MAYACASRYAGRYVVTVSVDQVMFRQPIHVGELVTFLASVNHTGRSSMEVGIKVVAEDIRTQEGATSTAASSRWWRWTRQAALPPLTPGAGDRERGAASSPGGAAQERASSSDPSA